MNNVNNNEINTTNTKKLLVTYDSAAGSTAEVAQYVGQVLAEEGHKVEIKHISEEPQLSDYDGVIIGGTIRYDHWLARLKKFVKLNRDELENIPVAYFFCCLVLSGDGEKNLRQADGYAYKIQQLAPNINPVDIKGFAGVLDYSKLSFPIRMLARVLFLFLRVKEGDYRDWKSINAWAKGIVPRLFPSIQLSIVP